MPQPYLTFRRVAFALIVTVMVCAAISGVMLVYDGTHHKSVAVPLVSLGTVVVIGMAAGGVFGWTNKKSPRWREWRKTVPTMTPGWPADGDH